MVDRATRGRRSRLARLAAQAEAVEAVPPSTRARILEAAVELFAQKGIARASLRDVAERAGVSLGGLQHHFPSKESLREGVLENLMEEYQHVQATAFAADDSDMHTLLHEGLRNYFRWARDRPELMAIAHRDALDGDLRSWPGEEPLTNELIRRVQAAQAAGRVDATLPPRELLALVGTIMNGWAAFGDALLEGLDDAQKREADERFADLVTRVLWRGLAPRGDER